HEHASENRESDGELDELEGPPGQHPQGQVHGNRHRHWGRRQGPGLLHPGFRQAQEKPVTADRVGLATLRRSVSAATLLRSVAKRRAGYPPCPDCIPVRATACVGFCPTPFSAGRRQTRSCGDTCTRPFVASRTLEYPLLILPPAPGPRATPET